MNCTVRNRTRDRQWRQYAELFEKIMEETLTTLEKTEEYAISVILVKKRKIHEINRDYRGIDRPTDVITFAAMEGEVFGMEEEIELGDIFINVDAVPSTDFRTQFPANASHTITSALPVKTSLASMLPIKLISSQAFSIGNVSLTNALPFSSSAPMFKMPTLGFLTPMIFSM